MKSIACIADFSKVSGTWNFTRVSGRPWIDSVSVCVNSFITAVLRLKTFCFPDKFQLCSGSCHIWFLIWLEISKGKRVVNLLINKVPFFFRVGRNFMEKWVWDGSAKSLIVSIVSFLRIYCYWCVCLADNRARLFNTDT